MQSIHIQNGVQKTTIATIQDKTNSRSAHPQQMNKLKIENLSQSQANYEDIYKMGLGKNHCRNMRQNKEQTSTPTTEQQTENGIHPNYS